MRCATAMLRQKTRRRPRSGMKSTKIICLCETEQDVIFPKPRMLKSVVVEKECDHCGTLWNFTFKNDLKCKKGMYHIQPKAISISQIAVEKIRAKEIKTKGTINE